MTKLKTKPLLAQSDKPAQSPGIVLTTNFKPFNLNQVKAVWIDVDQTLLDFDLCARDGLIAAFQVFGLEWKEEYFPIFLEENARLWDQIEEGKISRKDLRQIRFPTIFLHYGLPLKEPAAFEREFSQVLHSSAHPLKDAHRGLERLSQAGLPLFVISNGPSAGQKNRLEKAGMLEKFKRVFTSEDFGFAKPDLRFFQEALRQTCQILNDAPLQPGEILVIGDSWKADILGALNFGAQCVWITANRKFDPFTVESNPQVVEVETWRQIIQLLERKA